MLQAIENLLPPVANNLIQPDTAVDSDEQGPVVDPGGLGVGGHVRIHQLVPDANDLGFALALVHSKFGKDFRQEVAGPLGASFPGFLQRHDVDAVQLCQRPLASAAPRGTKWRDESRRS